MFTHYIAKEILECFVKKRKEREDINYNVGSLSKD